jgi:hypothetical protein
MTLDIDAIDSVFIATADDRFGCLVRKPAELRPVTRCPVA